MPLTTKEQLIKLINDSDIGEQEISRLCRKIQRNNLQKISEEVIQQARREFHDRSFAKAYVSIAAITLEEKDIKEALHRIIDTKVYENNSDRSFFDLFDVALGAGYFEWARMVVAGAYLKESRLSVVKLFMELAEHSRSSQDIESARNAVLGSDHYGFINDNLPRIVDLSVKIGDLEEARKTATAITNGYRQTLSFLKIFQITKDQSDLNCAREVASKAEACYGYYGHTQAEAYLEIFWQTHEAEDLKMARESARDYSDCLLKIADITKEDGDFEMAMSAALASMANKSDYHKNIDLFNFARKLAERGIFELARKAARLINDYGYQSNALVMIASFSHEEQDFRQALTALDKESINWARGRHLRIILNVLAGKDMYNNIF